MFANVAFRGAAGVSRPSGEDANPEVSPFTTMFCAKYITSSHNLDRVFRLKKNAVRVIFNPNPREPCRRDAFRNLGFFTLPFIYMMKFITYYISKFTIIRVRDIYQYATRGAIHFRTQKHRVNV